MKIFKLISIFFLLSMASVLVYQLHFKATNEIEIKLKPYEDLHVMRNYPDYEMGAGPYLFQMKRVSDALKKPSLKNTSTIPSWKIKGPFNVGGRINTIAHNPSNDQIIYVGSVCGGIHKTIDGGKNWFPIFDDNSHLAIGQIVVSKHDTNTLFAGTGDPNISGYPWVGNGIYKSTDAGITWQHLGLDNVGIVTKIAVHPQNSAIIYAATMGLPFVRDGNRGLYKTIDGGNTWNNILYLSDDAGIIDMVMVANSPDTIFVAGWNRIRNYNESLLSGKESKIYRTYDGGNTWKTLSIGLPEANMSRIGLCISAQDSMQIIAQFIKPNSFETEGIYASSNNGDTWNKLKTVGIDNDALGGFGWYFGKIRVNPFNKNQYFMLGVNLYKSDDGGSTFGISESSSDGKNVHADKHDLVFVDSVTLLLSTDGGLYKSVDGGSTWFDIDNIPNTQFYRVAIDPINNNFYCGGAQDNGTNYGSSADSTSWKQVFGGDGFQPLFDFTDPTILYVETQNGAFYSGNRIGASIAWENFIEGIQTSDRRSWDMPFCMSKQNPKVLYTGTYRVYKNNDAPSGMWQPVSDDLTDGTESNFHIISALAVSPLNDSLVMAGTSDGRVHIFNGTVWKNNTLGLPNRYVTCVKMSPNNINHVFVSHSGYKSNEYIPHIHFSDDFGYSWTDISGNLPQLAINSMVVLNGYGDSVIFVATDGGIYHTVNRGLYWERTGLGMPILPVYDLAYDDTCHIMVAGTFARGIMSLKLEEIIKKYQSVVTIRETEMIAQLYPNPATDFVFLRFNRQVLNAQIIIYDLSGRAIRTENLNQSNSTQINISVLPSGTYLLVLNEKGKRIATKKFVKCAL